MLSIISSSPVNMGILSQRMAATDMVRTALAEVNRPSGELHKLSVKLVNATAQAEAYKIIEPELSEKEVTVFKRGRNFKTGNTPKNSSGGDYHTATGLETLFGFLYLSGESERLKTLFNIIWQNSSVN